MCCILNSCTLSIFLSILDPHTSYMLLLLLDKEENLYQGTSHGQDDFLDDILDVKLKISRHTICAGPGCIVGEVMRDGLFLGHEDHSLSPFLTSISPP